MRYAVYVLTDREQLVFYAGLTDTLEERVFQHKTGEFRSPNIWGHCTQLVHCEFFRDFRMAAERHRRITRALKDMRRAFITRSNPSWRDLSEEWYDPYRL